MRLSVSYDTRHHGLLDEKVVFLGTMCEHAPVAYLKPLALGVTALSWGCASVQPPRSCSVVTQLSLADKDDS